MKIKQKIYNLLRWSEKYVKTDMVYLAKGGFWLTLRQMVSAVFGLLLIIAFTNYLSKEIYGTYKYVLSIASILAIPTLTGMGTSIVKSVARGYEGSFIPALKTKLSWGIFSSLASLGLSGYYFFQKNITLAICFLIAACFLPLLNSFNLYTSFLNGQKKFKLQVKYNIITQIIATAFLLIVLFFTKNLFLLIFTYFFSYTILHFIFLKITIKKTRLNQRQDPQAISFGKHLSLINVIGIIASQLDKILIWHFLGSTSVAIYLIATSIPVKIKDFLKSISILALPKFSQQSVQKLKKKIGEKTIRSFLITIPIVILYIFCAPSIYKFLFPQYLESIIYSQILILSLPIIIPLILLSTILVSQSQKRNLYYFNIISQIIKTILFLVLIPIYSIWGAIWTTVIFHFANFALLVFLLNK